MLITKTETWATQEPSGSVPRCRSTGGVKVRVPRARTAIPTASERHEEYCILGVPPLKAVNQDPACAAAQRNAEPGHSPGGPVITSVIK